MVTRPPLKLLICALLAAALTGCASPAPKKSSSSTASSSAQTAPATPAQPAGPTDAERFAEAVAQLNSGRLGDAEKTLTALVEKYPSRAAPLINLGILQARQGEWIAARDNLWKAVNLTGISSAHKAVANNELGIVLRHLGNHGEAEKAYKAALTARPDFSQAQLNLAILYDLYLKQPAAAIEHYGRYRKLLGNSDKSLQAQTALWIEQLKTDTGQ